MSNLQKYFDKIKKYSFTEYSELDATNIKEAREEFFKDSTLRVPHFRYERPEQTTEHLEGVLEELNRIRSSFMRDHGLKGSEKKLLHQLVRTAQRQATLLLAASQYRNGISPASSAVKFACCNKGEYGEPDRALTLSLLVYELQHLKVSEFGEDEKQVYQRLLVNLPEREDATVQFFIPRPETMAEFAELFRYYFGYFFEGVPTNQKEFTPEEIANIAERFIEQIRSWSDTRFRVEISDTKANFDVDQLERVLYVPRHRALGPYTREVVVEKLCAHEFVHIFRGVPYEHCGIPILATGFPGYDEAEEGITTACEYAIRGGEYTPPGLERYVDIGLLHHFGNQGCDFRRVYEIRRDLEYLSQVDPRNDAETKRKCFEQAKNKAFTGLSRATRGTGVLVYCKDLIYFNGNQKILQHIESVLNTEDTDDQKLMMDDFFWAGKTNPLDEQQMKIAYSAAQGDFGAPFRTPW